MTYLQFIAIQIPLGAIYSDIIFAMDQTQTLDVIALNSVS